MKNIFLLNGIIEGLAGFILLFRPQLLIHHAQPDIQGIAIAKLYGIIALSFGLISYQLSKSFNYHSKELKLIALVIIAFHIAVGLYMYGLYQQNITPTPGAGIVHIVIAVVFMMIYLKNMNNFNFRDHEPTP